MSLSDPSVSGRIAPAALVRHMVLPVAIVLVFALFGALQPAMLSEANLVNILKQSALFFFVAAAQLMVLITRGFDLSVGANISLVSVVSSMVMTALVPTLGAPIAIAAGIATGIGIGALIGAINGFFVAIVGINAFVVTLATMSVIGGIATTVSGGFPIFDLPEGFGWAFNQARWLILPVPVMLAVLVALGLHFVLSGTVHGRVLYILGDSPQAAHVAGRRVCAHHFFAYVWAGVLAAMGGLLMTAQTGSGEPNLGTSVVLTSIAAAVVGGASLRGGTGTVLAPLLGALLVTSLSVGMNLEQINGALQPVVVGVILVVGAALDAWRNARQG